MVAEGERPSISGSIAAKAGDRGNAGDGGSQLFRWYDGTDSPAKGYHTGGFGVPEYGIACLSGRACGVSVTSGFGGDDALATTTYLTGTNGSAFDGVCWDYYASQTCEGPI